MKYIKLLESKFNISTVTIKSFFLIQQTFLVNKFSISFMESSSQPQSVKLVFTYILDNQLNYILFCYWDCIQIS